MRYVRRFARRGNVVGKYVLGVISTVLAGLLLLLVTPSIQSWLAANDQQVELSSLDTMFISDGIQKSLSKNKERSHFRLMSIVNTGEQDLADLSLSIIGKDGEKLLDAGDALALRDAEQPATSLVDGKFIIKFALFKKDETVAFWVRTNSSELPVARSTQKGVSVLLPEEPGSSFPWDLMAMLGCGILLGIFAGIGLSEVSNRHVLKKIGFDPKEIEELYLKADKKGP